MSDHDKLEGISRRIPVTIQLQEYLDSVLETELINRLRYVFAYGLSSESCGIYAETKPSEIDGTDTTEPLCVIVDPTNSNQVIVYPGTAIAKSSHAITITQTHTLILAATTADAQNIVYLEYQNEWVDLVAMRSRTSSAASKRQAVDEEDMVKCLEKSAFEALDTATRNRIVAIALVTIQQTDSLGTLETVVDYSQSVASYNRPWFSPVDIEHRKMVGSGTASSSNPHGMTANDFMVAGDLSLYNALIGRGIVIAPAYSYAGVPGTACVETIESTRFVTDSTGVVTGTVGSKYVLLEGYPVSLGVCEKQDANAGTENATLLAVHQTGKEGTNIVWVDPDEPIETTTYKLYYTSVSALEPPTDYVTATSLTFGTPAGLEAFVSDGFAYNTLTESELSLENVGPIPRRVWIIYDDTNGLEILPQTLLNNTKLDDFDNDEVTVSTTFFGPGKLRVWLSNAIPNASLDVDLTFTGTDTSGNAITEIVGFDSTWADNPPPASAEKEEQGKLTTNTFATLTKIEITTRTADGPNSAVLVEVMPDAIYQRTSIERALHVARAFWNGFRVSYLADRREIVPSLREAGRPINEVMADSVLMRQAIWPAKQHDLRFHFGEDSMNMHFSDQRLTRKWGLRPEQGTEDPVNITSDELGRDAWYYSRAVRAKDNMRWLLAAIGGNSYHSGLGSDFQVRWTTTDDPGTWSSWTDTTASTIVKEYNNTSALAFYLYFPDIAGFDLTDSVYKYQIRFWGRWHSLCVFTSDEDLHAQTEAALIAALTTLFEVQHWGENTGGLDGKHKAVEIVPQSKDQTKLAILLHTGDKANYTTIRQIDIAAYTSGGVSTDGFIVYADGSVFIQEDLTLDGEVVGDLNVQDSVVCDDVEYNNIRTENVVVPLEHLQTYLGTAYDPDTAPGFINAFPVGPLEIMPWRLNNAGVGTYTIMFSLDPFIREGAKLNKIELLLRQVGAPNVITLDVTVEYAAATGVGVAWNLLASDTVTSNPGVQWDRHIETADFSLILPGTVTKNNIYRCTITATLANPALQLDILRITLKYSVGDDAAALNIE